MIKAVLAMSVTLALVGCATAPSSQPHPAAAAGARAVGQSNDSSYGFTQENPVRVGGPDVRGGPKREREFLESLRGPSGQRVVYQRTGSCCSFQTANGYEGRGLLDKYRVTYEGLAEPVTIYINLYDPGPPLAPVGFTVDK